MCKWGTEAYIVVIDKGPRQVAVDACLVPYIQQMNSLGILTLNCCCGHGKTPYASVLVDPQSQELMDRLGYEWTPYYVHEDDEEYLLEHRFVTTNTDER